jgi:hypothetical protein
VATAAGRSHIGASHDVYELAVEGEPGYVDQVPRRERYQAAHPNVEIRYHGSYWQAIVREDAGEIVITRYELRGLLDKLESLDHPAG